jgi:transcriptional regulator with XRE-family HTH domain
VSHFCSTVSDVTGKQPLSHVVTSAIRVRLSSMQMSTRDLSRRTGISNATLARWVKDQGSPGLDDLQKIADALATTPEKLLKGVTR